ncbi:MAG: nucleoside deaminase [Bacilli bacterium]
MELALQQALLAWNLGEVPIGAVVVSEDGRVIGAGCNSRETTDDATAHAEMAAIREAGRAKGDWRLTGCALYVTVEPCLMCAGAISQSRISQVVYGAQNPKGGAIESLVEAYGIKGLNHYPAVTGGVLATKCGMILKDFFREQR